MSYVYDEQEKGYRLVCGGCGQQSPVMSLEEKAIQGVEWWCSDLSCEQIYLAHQRARFKFELVKKGMTPDRAETEIVKLRWDMMPDKDQKTPPTREQIEQAEILERRDQR